MERINGDHELYRVISPYDDIIGYIFWLSTDGQATGFIQVEIAEMENSDLIDEYDLYAEYIN